MHGNQERGLGVGLVEPVFTALSWRLEEKEGWLGSMKEKRGKPEVSCWQGTLLDRQDERKGDSAERTSGRIRLGVGQGDQSSLECKHLLHNEKPPDFLFELPSFLEGSLLSLLGPPTAASGLSPSESQIHNDGNLGILFPREI